MAKRGRPWPVGRAASARIVNLKLRLYPGEDDDLIAFFGAIPPRMRVMMVKQALRSGSLQVMFSDVPDDDEVMDALDALVLF